MSSSSIFESLPTRPPTPPKDISSDINDALNFLDDSNEVERATTLTKFAKPSVDTPPLQSPSSSLEAAQASQTSGKRVGFSPWPTYHRISRIGQSSSPRSPQPKQALSLRNLRPLKSILKASNEPPSLTPEELDPQKLCYFSPDEPGSFRKMLQSVLNQLASQSRASRLDAYLALNGALKAYEGMPDPESMREKMGLIMQFLTRDMAWKDADGTLDTNIATQALKLTGAILFDGSLSKSLDDDFKSFLVDRSIIVMEQADMPKPIVKTHMYLLTQQRFHHSVMSSSRAEKIVTALHTIESRVSGNSSIATRLVIYQRLLEQAPAVMVMTIRDWLEHVFHGMLSSIKDIRTRAIEVSTQAGLALGTNYQATKALMDLFETEIEESQTYGQYLSLRLIQMIGEKEVGLLVPQIWSAVVTFFRSKRKRIEMWSRFKDWLLVLQKCLNIGDLQIKHQANLAWNRLVYVVMPDASTSKPMISMLKVPICVGLDKRGKDKHSRTLRQIALDSYNMLLHYALRPSLSHDELDLFWDAYIETIIPDMAKSSMKGRITACRILCGLFSSNGIGIWNENAANESASISPEDLPRLDPRWVRLRLCRILKVVEPIMSTCLWLPVSNDGGLDSLWSALMRSVAEAGSQEVKTSVELKEAIAHLMNSFRRIWSSCVEKTSNTPKSSWILRLDRFLCSMIEMTGGTHFAEEILSRTRDDGIEAAPTPSHRPSKHHKSLQSPLVFLFGLFYHPPRPLDANSDFYEAAGNVLHAVCSCKVSQASRLELVAQSLQTWTTVFATDSQPDVVVGLWCMVANEATSVLAGEVIGSPNRDSQELGQQLRSAMTVLVYGLQHSTYSDECFEVSRKLYQTLLKAAKLGAGDGGVVLAAMEPFAQALTSAGNTRNTVELAACVLQEAVWPRSRQAIDQGRKSLWGVGLAPHKMAVYDPFEEVYNMVNELLLALYKTKVETDAIDEAASFLLAVVLFLEGCPATLLATALRKTQIGMAIWIEDAQKTLSAAADTYRVKHAVAWQRLLALITTLPKKDSNVLKALENLLTAGFKSSRRAIVNDSVTFWNKTFGEEETLEYPCNLEAVLRSLNAHVELSLPCFPEGTAEGVPATLPSFIDSQFELDEPTVAQEVLSRPTSAPSDYKPPPGVRSVYFSAARSALVKSTSASSPVQGSRRTPLHPTPKTRLRHDDSQIQFAPIESSPLEETTVTSQILTDHQKEVKARQRNEAAHMFPDLSSSPDWKSTAKARDALPRLDFSSDHARGMEAQEDGYATPTLLDTHDNTNGFMGSSPTPRAHEKHGEEALEKNSGQDDRENLVADAAAPDPPSSPPQMAEQQEQMDQGDEAAPFYLAGPDDTTVDVTTAADPSATIVVSAQVEAVHETVADEEASDANAPENDMSDSRMPAAQLQQEEEAADGQDNRVEAVTSEVTADEPWKEADLAVVPSSEVLQSDAYVDAPTEPQHEEFVAAATDSSPIHLGESQETAEPSQSQSFEQSTTTGADDTSRVENSFIEPAAGDADDASVSAKSSQQSPRASRKRKRPSEIGYTTKKQKQQSPFKRLFSRFIGQKDQPAEDDDEDIEDNITVASKSPQAAASSVAREDMEQAMSSAAKALDVPPETAVLKTEAVDMAVDQTRLPPKRGRGRPRKPETPADSPSQPAAPERMLKRRASAISNQSINDNQDADVGDETTIVTETPAPAKAKRQCRSKAEMLTERSQLSTDELTAADVPRTSRRSAAAVLVPATRSSALRIRASASQDKNAAAIQASPEKQLADEQAAASRQNRRIAKPKGILDRLRGVYAELKTTLLGSQEEREFDDLLFAIRREVHEAGRRGREEQ